MEDLIVYESTVVEELLSRIKNFCREKGIILPTTFVTRDEAEKNSESLVADSQWVKPFIIQTDEPAFYLKINSPDDIALLNKDLEQALSELQDSLKKFLENNRELEESLRSKINTFATAHLVQAKKAVKFSLKKLKTATTVIPWRNCVSWRANIMPISSIRNCWNESFIRYTTVFSKILKRKLIFGSLTKSIVSWRIWEL